MLQNEVVGNCEATPCSRTENKIWSLATIKTHKWPNSRLQQVPSQVPTTSICSTTQDLSFDILHDQLPVLTFLPFSKTCDFQRLWSRDVVTGSRDVMMTSYNRCLFICDCNDTSTKLIGEKIAKIWSVNWSHV